MYLEFKVLNGKKAEKAVEDLRRIVAKDSPPSTSHEPKGSARNRRLRPSDR